MIIRLAMLRYFHRSPAAVQPRSVKPPKALCAAPFPMAVSRHGHNNLPFHFQHAISRITVPSMYRKYQDKHSRYWDCSASKLKRSARSTRTMVMHV